jgi:hypothetical protein
MTRRIVLAVGFLAMLATPALAVDLSVDRQMKVMEERQRLERERRLAAEKIYRAQQHTIASPIQSTLSGMPGESVRQPAAQFFMRADIIPAKDMFGSPDAKEIASKFIPDSQGTFSGSKSESGTPLITAGFLYPMSRRLEVGWAMGYATAEEESETFHTTGVASHRAAVRTTAKIVRLTNNVRVRSSGRPIQFRLAAGLGLSLAEMTSRSNENGSGFLGGFTSFAIIRQTDFSKIGWGPTFDVAPSIAFQTKALTIDVGVSFTYFGNVSVDDSAQPLTWKPVGARVTVEF